MSETPIPDSIRLKIHKLLALAKDTRGNEHETQLAASMVQKLLSEYNLEMSQIGERPDGKPVDPSAERAKAENAFEAMAEWQAKLLGAIAENNFCFRVRETHDAHGNTYAEPVFSLIGRRVNIETTRQLYDYLVSAIDRLCPRFPIRKSARSWKEGCAARLAERLYTQRRESEAASRAEQGEGTRGNGSDLVLSDVYSSEDDLNRDFRYGWEPGTSARQRAESEARWAAEREARRNAPTEPQRTETAAERRTREAYERKWHRRWESEARKQASKIDREAYAMGRDAGANISLNRQIREGKRPVSIG